MESEVQWKNAAEDSNKQRYNTLGGLILKVFYPNKVKKRKHVLRIIISKIEAEKSIAILKTDMKFSNGIRYKTLNFSLCK